LSATDLVSGLLPLSAINLVFGSLPLSAIDLVSGSLPLSAINLVLASRLSVGNRPGSYFASLCRQSTGLLIRFPLSAIDLVLVPLPN
jgi:hypothetical protein